MTTAFVFAGQGAEEPAMGLALARAEPDAAAMLAIASEVTGVDVPRALERGGRALGATEVLQPVLTAVGLASARALSRRGIRPAFVAGHSLGELTAACFAAELDPRDAIELAAVRGAAMARAAAEAPGGMVALRASEEEVQAALDELPGLELAAVNARDEVVLAGPNLDSALARFGARAAKLRVAGAWHSSAMRSAVEPVRARLAAKLAEASFSARLLASSEGSITDVLAEGIVRPVRFTDVLARLEREGVRRVIACAPSRVVRSLVRRSLRARVELFGADDPRSLDALARR